MPAARIASLIRLEESELALADPAEDVRGCDVLDSEGKGVGEVRDVMIDAEERHARFLIVAAGGFLGGGAHELLIPIDAIWGVTAEGVHLARTREEVSSGPPSDPELAGDAGYCAGIYGWYGYMPFWQPGYSYPSERFVR